jgi:NAD(P)-dependent dehydrogenase (short-subunit alcohol dehydrogenase family)
MRAVADMSVLITGGGSGIGAGTARYFSTRGARVTIADLRPDKLPSVRGEAGPNCQAVAGDVTDEADRARMIEAAVAHGGGLDLLVNAAGNMLRGAITDLDEQAVLDLFDVNVVSAMRLTGMCVPHLEARRGAVIFFGSAQTRRAFPGASPYTATKAAAQALTRVLAAELGPRGIRVNCVVPGAVPTEINQRAGLFDDAEAAARAERIPPEAALGRVGTAEEIAEAIDYLARAEWTTGALLDIDGGLGLGVSRF